MGERCAGAGAGWATSADSACSEEERQRSLVSFGVSGEEGEEM